MEELAETLQTLERIQNEFEDIAVAGLRVVGVERLPAIDSLVDEFSKVGANHIADRLRQLAAAIREDSRECADHLMRAQASIRMFERVLTIETAGDLLRAIEVHQAGEQDE